jgi:hypothetical protein
MDHSWKFQRCKEGEWIGAFGNEDFMPRFVWKVDLNHVFKYHEYNRVKFDVRIRISLVSLHVQPFFWLEWNQDEGECEYSY